MSYEFSLVGFTVLGQLAAGLAFLVWITGLHRLPKVEHLAWRLALGCGIVGFGGAVFHLTAPMASLYSITQVSHSWLSREIWGVGIFGLLLLLRVSGVLGPRFNALVGLVGVAFVVVTAQVYHLAVVPFWDTWGTETSFLGTAFLLGGAMLAALCVDEENTCGFQVGFGACLAGAFASSALPLFWISALLTPGIMPDALPLLGTLVKCLGLTHMAMAVVGLALLARARTLSWSPLWAWLAVLVLVAGEVLGRMLFYAANIRVGM